MYIQDKILNIYPKDPKAFMALFKIWFAHERSDPRKKTRTTLSSTSIWIVKIFKILVFKVLQIVVDVMKGSLNT